MAITAGFTPLVSCSSDDSTYNIIGGLKSITCNGKRVQLDRSEMGYSYEMVRAGLLKGRTITLSGLYATADTGQARVRTLFASGAAMYTQIAWDGTTGADIDNGATKVRGYTVKFANAGWVEWDIDLVLHAAWDTTHHAEAAYTLCTPIAGHTSRLTIADTVGGSYLGIGGVKDASLKIERAMLETEDQESTYTGAAAGCEQFTAGIMKGTFSCSGDFGADASGQAHIRSGLMNRADRFVKFLTDGTNGWILQTAFTGYSLPTVDPKGANKFSTTGQFVTMTATP